MKRLTIYDIKRLTPETAPHFFDRSSMRFFGQTLRDFHVYKQSDGRYLITANYGEGKPRGQTVRYFDPITNQLDMR